MTQQDKFENEARYVFDADLSLRQGTVFYEPITDLHLPIDDDMPLIYECVQSQLESVAESFGVEFPPEDPLAAKSQLRKELFWARQNGYTIVFIWTQLEEPENENLPPGLSAYLHNFRWPTSPCIPGLVALFTDWPQNCMGIRDCTVFGSRMVHAIFASYDVLGDLRAIRKAAENLGNPEVDPNNSIQYPACA